MKSLIKYEFSNLFKPSSLFKIATIIMFLLFFVPIYGLASSSTMFVVIFFSIMSFSFYNDTNNGFEKFKISLPIKREDVVYSKYVTLSITIIPLMILSVLLFSRHFFNIGMGSLILDGIISIVTVVVIMSLVFPVYFYNGFTKGSFIFSIMISISTYVISAKYFTHYLWNISGNNFVFLNELKALILIMVAVSFLVLLSMRFSVKLYSKREIRG